MKTSQKAAAIRQHAILVQTGMGLSEAIESITSLFTDADDKKNMRAALLQHISELESTIEILN
jgi:type II secretory pathway component PulF